MTLRADESGSVQLQEPLDPRSARLLSHAFQRYCGVELLEQRPGYCRTGVMVTESVDNLGHTLHGGVIYSLMDVTSMLATLPMVETDSYPLTTSLSINVLRAAERGSRVAFEAQVTRAGRRMIFSQAQACIIGGPHDGKTVATAQIVKARVVTQDAN